MIKFKMNIYVQPVIQLVVQNNSDTDLGEYQQRLTMDWSKFPSSFTSKLNPDLSNITILNADGERVYAWLESDNFATSKTSTDTIWVKIPSLKAHSNYNLYLYPSGEFDGVYWGEAPQLSSTYAEYDNGKYVFNFYDNFAGTTLGSEWNSGASGGTITVNNGLTETIPYNSSSSSYTYISTKDYQITGPSIIQSYANLNSFDTTNYRIVPVSLTQYNNTAWHADNSINEIGGGWVGNAFQTSGIDAETTNDSSDNGFVHSNYISSNSNYNVFGIIYPDNGSFAVSYNSLSAYASTTSLVPSTPLYITISNWLDPSQTAFTTTYPMNVYWIRVLTYISSMPTVYLMGGQ